MTPEVKNRLVGSIILVLAAVIIIPSVLDGKKVSYKDDFKPVPERPEFESVQSTKAFPGTEFDQHMPKASDEITDEQPVDAEEIAARAAQAAADASKQAEAGSTKILENDTVTVATLSRPVDFSAQLTSNPKQAEAQTEQAESPVSSNQPPSNSAFSSFPYVIQLGAFGLKANAAALERKLNAAGYTTFSRPIKNRSGATLTKVYVGPELDKAVLEQKLAGVNKVSGLKGSVILYDVTK